MSRFRNRTLLNALSPAEFWQGGLSIDGGSYSWSNFCHTGVSTDNRSPVGQRINFRVISHDEITDEPTPSGGMPFKPCTHLKMCAALFDCGRIPAKQYTSFSRTGHVYSCKIKPGVGQFWVSPYDYSALVTNLQTAVSNVDYTSSVVALARTVKGLVNSKSLLAVTLKELPETIRMVRNPFGLLKRGWRQIAMKHSASQLAKKGANLWLEYQYGWRASYYDMQQFCKSYQKYKSSLQRYQEQSEVRIAETRYASLAAPNPTISNTDWQTLKSHALANYTPEQVNCEDIPHFRCVYYGGVVKSVASCRATDVLDRQLNSFDRLLSAYGLSGDKLFENIWEALPYSFVVDWFVNTQAIADTFRFQDALDTLTQARVTHLGYSAKAHVSFDAQAIPDHRSSNWNWIWGYRPMDFQVDEISSMSPGSIVYYKRSLGVPPSNVSVFGDLGLSVTQGVSGFSLLFQRLLKH